MDHIQQTLEDLYRGNIHPSEDMRVHMEGYKTKQKELDKTEEELLAKLTWEQSVVFHDFTRRNSDLFSDQVTQGFVDGVRMGAKLAVEIFMDQYLS